MRNRTSTCRPYWQHGLTLVELLIAVTILAIVLAVALPSFQSFAQSIRLRGAAFGFLETVHQARTEAIKRDLPEVSIKFLNTGGNWCYRVTDTPNACVSCDFSDQVNRCDVAGDGVIKGDDAGNYVGLAFQPTYVDGVLTLSNRRGTMEAGNVAFSIGTDKQVQVKTSGVGRVRICVPNGYDGIFGVEGC
ncbi:GspH/FimT family pseudopilin [Ferrimonas gelatinilytica]|uniref:Type II secretion system protein H n=1 Tax=Ferrimonas gelatinilytica TaxID=1255257 RepID=A0ABP9SC31_9GAMM